MESPLPPTRLRRGAIAVASELAEEEEDEEARLQEADEAASKPKKKKQKGADPTSIAKYETATLVVCQS